MGKKWMLADTGLFKTMASKAARKFQVALGAAVVTGIPLVADGEVTLKDGLAIAFAFAGALGVFVTTNKPKES